MKTNSLIILSIVLLHGCSQHSVAPSGNTSDSIIGQTYTQVNEAFACHPTLAPVCFQTRDNFDFPYIITPIKDNQYKVEGYADWTGPDDKKSANMVITFYLANEGAIVHHFDIHVGGPLNLPIRFDQTFESPPFDTLYVGDYRFVK